MEAHPFVQKGFAAARQTGLCKSILFRNTDYFVFKFSQIVNAQFSITVVKEWIFSNCIITDHKEDRHDRLVVFIYKFNREFIPHTTKRYSASSHWRTLNGFNYIFNILSIVNSKSLASVAVKYIYVVNT